MKNRKSNTVSLPNGLVVVDKGSAERQVQIGILNGSGMPTFGFDVRGMAPNHYRIVEHGPFGVVVGAKQPLEVRVLLDGKVLLEKILEPTANPAPGSVNEALYRKMIESPQAHLLKADGDGNLFMFNPSDSGLNDTDYIAEQIHPGTLEAAPALAQVDGGEVLEELKVDLNPEDFGFQAPAPESDADVSVADHIAGHAERLANESAEDAESDASELDVDHDDADGETAQAIEADSKLADEGPNADEAKVQRPDTLTQAKSWAPSHGLIAVGIRMVQHVQQGEMIPTAPDAFQYTLFQMNPWRLHHKVHAKLMGRVIVPSMEDLARMTAEEGFEDELSGHSHVCCGLKHKH